MLVLHSFFLVARTYLSVVVARVDGKIVKELIAGNGPGFTRGLLYWFAIAVPATYTNSMVCAMVFGGCGCITCILHAPRT